MSIAPMQVLNRNEKSPSNLRWPKENVVEYPCRFRGYPHPTKPSMRSPENTQGTIKSPDILCLNDPASTQNGRRKMVQTTGTENGHRKPRAPEQKTVREHGGFRELSDAPHSPPRQNRGRRERTDATLSEPGMPRSGWPAQPWSPCAERQKCR